MQLANAAINSASVRAEQILEKLVAFDSVSHKSNLSIIGFIEGYLKAYKVECQRVMSPDGTKSNLLARIGPDIEGGIVLSGHTDVVPVEGQSWDTEPFNLTENAGRLYGRGSADMKGFIASCLSMVSYFTQAKLTKPIWLAFSYDEEVGCLGAPVLLDYISKHIPKPSLAIIGEPTLMQVVTAHKGMHAYETHVHGLEWHSSQTNLGVNAIHIACDLIHQLKGMHQTLTSTQNDERFDPPHTSIHVGMINGGTARNIIPKECSFQWEIRPLPHDDQAIYFKQFEEYCDVLRQQMRAVYDNADIVTTSLARMDGVSLPENAQTARELVMHCAKTNQEHAVAYGTEAGVFQQYGIPAIVCGPGDIQQAHKPNEFIERLQIQECIIFLGKLLSELSEKTST